MFKHTILFGSLAAFSVLTFANDDSLVQEQIVTVASRTAVPERAISSSISILDEEALINMGYLSLSDAIASLPSTNMANSGGLGKATSMSVRGEAGFRTQVYIDGINVADISAPQTVTAFEHILSSGVSRVEVLRGPQGLAYGADAGGVIHISTQGPASSGLHAGADFETGSYGSQLASGIVHFDNDTVSASVNIASLESDGFNTSVYDLSEDEDGYENTTLHTRISAKLSNNVNLEGVYRSVEGSTDYDSCYDSSTFALIHECYSDYEQDSQGLALKVSQFGQHRFGYSATEIIRKNYSANIFSFGAEGKTEKLEYQGEFKPSDTQHWVFGLDDLSESLNDVQRERGQQGAYVEYLATLPSSIYFNAGLRRDENDDFGSFTSYRLGAAKIVSVNKKDELKFKASVGTGFRAPAIYEEYLNEAFGPPDMPALREETSQGFDLGLEFYGAQGLHLEAIYFSQRVEDEIYYDLIGFSGYLQGEGEAKSSGLELIADVPLSETWSYRFNYSYTDSEQNDGSVRSRIPRHSGSLSLLAALLEQRLHLALHLNAVADIYDAVAMQALDNYRLLNATLRYELTSGVDLYLRVENIADEEYQSVPAYYAAEASAYAGVKLRF